MVKKSERSASLEPTELGHFEEIKKSKICKSSLTTPIDTKTNTYSVRNILFEQKKSDFKNTKRKTETQTINNFSSVLKVSFNLRSQIKKKLGLKITKNSKLEISQSQSRHANDANEFLEKKSPHLQDEEMRYVEQCVVSDSSKITSRRCNSNLSNDKTNIYRMEKTKTQCPINEAKKWQFMDLLKLKMNKAKGMYSKSFQTSYEEVKNSKHEIKKEQNFDRKKVFGLKKEII